jgi:hypothetical protein
MRRIIIAAAAIAFTSGAAFAQSPTQPPLPKENPQVEKQEQDKTKGNVENQNPNDTKAKEQAPPAKK